MYQLEYIKTNLYSEEKYPRKNFPKLNQLLEKRFTKFRKLYSEDELSDTSLIESFFSITTLIKESPADVLTLFDHMVWQIIRKHCFNTERHDDVFQEMMLDLLDKRFEYVINNYSPEAPFVPYFAIILIRLCQEKQSKYLSKDVQNSSYEEEIIVNQSIENKLLIDEEFQKLEQVLYALNNNRMLVMFKFVNHFQLSKEEVKKAFPRISKWDLQKLSSTESRLSEQRLKYVSKFLNKYNNKKSKPDSLRRLVDLYIDEACKQLNSISEEYTYTKKTIIELYSQRVQQIKREIILKVLLFLGAV